MSRQSLKVASPSRFTVQNGDSQRYRLELYTKSELIILPLVGLDHVFEFSSIPRRAFLRPEMQAPVWL